MSGRWDTEDFHSGDFEVAKEGGAWTSAIESVAGEEWTPLEGSIVTAVDMAPDGTVWVFWEDRWQDPAVQRRAEVFAYLDEDGWQTLGHLDRVNDLLVAGPDDIWATAGLWPRNYLHRFVDGAWQRLVGFEGTEPTWQPAEEPVADDTGQFDHGPDPGVESWARTGRCGASGSAMTLTSSTSCASTAVDGAGGHSTTRSATPGSLPAVASPLRVASDWQHLVRRHGATRRLRQPLVRRRGAMGRLLRGSRPLRWRHTGSLPVGPLHQDHRHHRRRCGLATRRTSLMSTSAMSTSSPPRPWRTRRPKTIEPPVSEEPTDAEEMLTATEKSMPGMVTEEVEPGVLRVINDGVRDLGSVEAMDIVAGYDDGTGPPGKTTSSDSAVTVSTSGPADWGTCRGDDFEVTPPWHDFEVTADGMVWAAMETDADLESEPQDSGVNLWSSYGSEWEPHKLDLSPRLVDRRSPRTAPCGPYGSPTRQARQRRCSPATSGRMSGRWWWSWPNPGSSPYVSDEGDVWAFGGAQMMGMQVHRFVDGVWLDDGPQWASGDVGPDGTVWVNSSGGFQRFDGAEWSPFGMPDWRWGSDWGDVRVAPDGSVWVAARLDVPGGQVPVCGEGVGGVARFDGVTWSPHLPGRCVAAFDIAGDGSVGVLADDALYFITLEAVAGTE